MRTDGGVHRTARGSPSPLPRRRRPRGLPPCPARLHRRFSYPRARRPGKVCHLERFPDATEAIVDSIPDWLQQATLPANAYVVILTRGHRYDLDALRALAPRDLRYLGLIGSRAKIARLYDALREESVPPDQLQKVHAPVGLNIGAVTPQEIAVSILAELIAIKYGRLGAGADQASDAVASLRWAPPETSARRSLPTSSLAQRVATGGLL